MGLNEKPAAAPYANSQESLFLQMFRLKGTVVVKIWWQTVIMALYTVTILCLHNFVDGLHMDFPLSLVPVLGVVTGLLLVFRTNTAYDRYWEGRRLWSHMTYQIRSLTMSIWVGIEDHDQSEAIIEKTSAINLLVAFAFATKNYLRGEYSYDEEDMKDLISHLPRFQTPSSNTPLSTQGSSSASLKRKNNKKNLDEKIPTTNTNDNDAVMATSVPIIMNSGSTTILVPDDCLSPPEKNQKNLKEKKMKKASSKFPPKKPPPPPPSRAYSLKAYDHVTPSNIPLEICYYVFAYLRGVAMKNGCDGNIMRNMQGSVLSLIDCLTGFERILRTPMPMAYRLHLVVVVWLYLLALPFQLAGSLNWFTLPATILASFALLGILGIGGEIENPFGYDHNDLPLDDFCKVIRREIQVILAHPMRHLFQGTWVMSTENHPFAPASWLSAPELATKSGNDLRLLLARGAEVTENSHL